MADKRPTAAGGFLIALGILGGAGVGFAIGQATPGLLIGTAIGVAAALLVWIRDRRSAGSRICQTTRPTMSTGPSGTGGAAGLSLDTLSVPSRSATRLTIVRPSTRMT